VIHRMPGDHATLSSYCGAGDMIFFIYIYCISGVGEIGTAAHGLVVAASFFFLVRW
jgi:hypothetical protein